MVAVVAAESAAWTRVADALSRVEAVGPDDSGLLAFGDEPGAGGILVERGRVCWAVAPGMQGRFKDLLATSTAARALDLDAVVERCRLDGRRLAQALLDAGFTTGELEAALRRHSAESLFELCRAGELAPRWTSRGAHGYSPQFTFRPLDVLLDVAELAVPELHRAGALELAQIAGPDRRAGAYCFDPRRGFAVPVAAVGETSVHELWRLGAWAAGVPLATRELGVTPALVLAATAAGEQVAVWWRAPLVYAVICGDRAGAAAIVAYHARSGGS